MTRDEAMDLLKAHLEKDAMLKHSLASEAVMRGVAEKLGYDVELWGITGLLHDIDFEKTEETPERHGLVAMEILPATLAEDVRNAVCRHNEANGSVRSTSLDFALSASESLTGLITATALVYPDKRVASVKVKSVTKRMKEKAFARNVSRECILECEKIGLSLDSFVETGISSMGKIAAELGL